MITNAFALAAQMSNTRKLMTRVAAVLFILAGIEVLVTPDLDINKRIGGLLCIGYIVFLGFTVGTRRSDAPPRAVSSVVSQPPLIRMKTKASAYVGLVGIGVLALNNPVASQESARPEPKVVKDLVKGSIHHRPPGGKQVEWERIVGKVQIINPSTLQFADGSRIDLGPTPELNEQAPKVATEFLRKLIGEQPVMCFFVEAQDDKWIGYVGDTNLTHALVINGWGLAHHSSLHPAEIAARENKRGLWRGQFLDPDE